jgi:hypothetical protein
MKRGNSILVEVDLRMRSPLSRLSSLRFEHPRILRKSLNNRSTEHGLGPDGQVAGFVAVHGIVAQRALGDLKVSGQGALDLAVLGCRADIETIERDIEAAAVETDVQDRLGAE